MVNLQELVLLLFVYREKHLAYIDGAELYNVILLPLTQLTTVTFFINTYVQNFFHRMKTSSAFSWVKRAGQSVPP